MHREAYRFFPQSSANMAATVLLVGSVPQWLGFLTNLERSWLHHNGRIDCARSDVISPDRLMQLNVLADLRLYCPICVVSGIET